jgi:hypothetical protein
MSATTTYDAALKPHGGLPTLREEAWKFTSLAALAKAPYAVAKPAEVEPSAIAALRLDGRSHALVFVNGRFRPDLSDLCRLPGKVTVEPGVAAPVASDWRLAAINEAFVNGGRCWTGRST